MCGQRAGRSSPAPSRSASTGSNAIKDRLKLQNEVAQLCKTIERNEATAALEWEIRNMRHELSVQKLNHELALRREANEKAMLLKDLAFEKERSTLHVSPREKPSDDRAGQVPG